MFQINVLQQNQTHILCSITFFPENRDIVWKNMVDREIMWKNMVDREIMWKKYGRS